MKILTSNPSVSAVKRKQTPTHKEIAYAFLSALLRFWLSFEQPACPEKSKCIYTWLCCHAHSSRGRYSGRPSQHTACLLRQKEVSSSIHRAEGLSNAMALDWSLMSPRQEEVDFALTQLLYMYACGACCWENCLLACVSPSCTAKASLLPGSLRLRHSAICRKTAMLFHLK